MPLIYSGREANQVFNQVGNKLVRRSNALEDDHTGGIDPEVRRVISAIHREMPDAFAALAWIGGPDGYEISGPNRISKMREIVPGSGDATQGTAADQPELSRADDRMNLVTHSRLPGTQGGTTLPDGWGQAGSDVIPDLVASDDASDGHQACEATLSSQQSRITQAFATITGQRLILAVKIEHNGWTGGDAVGNRLTGGTISLTTLARHDNLDTQVQSGEWAWWAVNVDEGGSGTMFLGLGLFGAASGTLRYSRPIAAYLPPQSEVGPDLDDNASVQAWLTDHYAASGPDHQEFAGFRGMRGFHVFEQSLNTTFTFPDNINQLTMAAFHTAHRQGGTDRFGFFSGARRLYIDTFGRYRFDLEEDDGSTVLAALSGSETSDLIYAPRLLTGTAKVGGDVKLYVDDDLKVTGSSVGSLNFSGANHLRFGFSTAGTLFSMYWFFVFNKELTATEVASLNSIIRNT